MNNPQTHSEVQLFLKVVSYLKTHWWVFLAEVAVIFTVAMWKYAKTSPVYESEVTMLIDSSRRQLYQSVVSSSPNPFMLYARKQNIVHLFTSEEVMGRFRAQLSDFYNSEGKPSHLRDYFPKGTAITAGNFNAPITLNYDRGSDIYSVRCQAENALAARDLCLVYMNTIQTYYPEYGQREVITKRDFLLKQIIKLTAEISDTEHQLGEFQKNNREFMSFVMLNVEGKSLEKLREEVVKLQQKIASNREIKKSIIHSPHSKANEQNALGTAIKAMSAQISELQYELYLTRQSKSPDKNQRLRSLNSEIARVSSQLSKLNEAEEKAYVKNPIPTEDIRKRLTEVEMDYRTDSIKVKNLEGEIHRIQEEQTQYQTESLEYDKLQAGLLNKRKLLTFLYEKQQETEIELSAGSAEIFRLREPTLPSFRLSPQISKNLFAGISFSVMASVATLLLFFALMPRIDSEAEVQRLNLPILGKLPLLPRQSGAFEEIPSFGLEYLKIMNYRILRETKDLKCPIIVISSSNSREGKSTVSQLLTLASQAPNRKTLLIDSDLMTSNPNQFFGIKEDHNAGLKGLLEGARMLDYNSLIVKTAVQGLYFLPRGGRVESINSPTYLKPLESVLASFRKEFDLIIVDTPPLFAGNLPHQWTVLADLIVLVARIYRTRPKDIVEGIRTCKIFSKAPVGVALNGLPMSGQERRASNYYFSKTKIRPNRMAA